MTNQVPGSAETALQFDDSEVADYAAMSRLDGKTFAVIGGGNGIGRQVAHALTGAGAKVVVVDLSAERAAAVAAEVGGTSWSGDVTNRDDVIALFETIREAGNGLHGVVDIVGMSRYKRLTELTDDDWLWHDKIVFRHAYLVLQYGSPLMSESGGGPITFVASVNGIGSSANLAAYGAAKAALISLVKSAAVELGPQGVRVNAIAPGMVRTPRSVANSAWTEELLAINIGNTPVRQLAQPSDVAGSLLMMSLPLARHITGQTVVVDGGLSTAVGVVTPTP